jgi:hypothetical protein
LHNRTGEDACPGGTDRTADAHLKRAAQTGCTLAAQTGCTLAAETGCTPQVMGRKAVVAVTEGRLDSGTWERILCQLDG